MAQYFVSSSGSNTSPYDTWAKACTSLQTALAAATSDGDSVIIKYNGVPSADAEVSGVTSYTAAADIVLLSASADDAATAFTPTAMGSSYWLGNSTTNRALTIGGADKNPLFKGITFRTAGSTAANINLDSSTGCSPTFEYCYFWQGNTATTAIIQLSNVGAFVNIVNCTFTFGHASQKLAPALGRIYIIGGTIAGSGSVPTNLIVSTGTANINFIGVDLSSVNTTLVSDLSYSDTIIFDRCKLASGVVPLATQISNPTLSSPEVYILDSAYGDVQGFFGYYNALGQITTDTGIYKTTNNSGDRSWKIVTTSYAAYCAPFTTPPIDVYNTGTSSITPYLEILRDGSSSAYKDNEVWARFEAKVTSGYSISSLYEDKQDIGAYAAGTTGSNQASGAGTGEWTGESGTAWSGKIDSGSAFTPAESGALTAQICVGVASSTIYVDPEIRGL